jgi:hypothetical protein
MFANFEMNLSWSELIKRTFRETMKDDAQGLASQLAYYFFLALFPALLCLLAIASFFPLHHFTDDVVRLLGPFAPREVLTIIQQEMMRISEGNHGGLLTFGLLAAVLEQLVGDGVGDRRDEPCLRHRRGPPVVEGPRHRGRTHGRIDAVHRDRVRADHLRSAARRFPGAAFRIRRRCSSGAGRSCSGRSPSCSWSSASG